MTDVVLTLGEFTFARFEAPEQIPFGGDQRLVVHQLVGGKRVIDAMGEEPPQLEWSGIFTGSTALARARFLDGMRRGGAQHPLTWSEMAFTVVIRSFRPDFRAPFRIPYHLVCEVVSDDTAPQTDLPQADADKQVGDDMGGATALGGIIGNGSITAGLATITSAIGKVSSFATATQREIRSVLDPIAQVQGQVALLRASVGNTLINAGTFGGLLPRTPIAAGATALAQQVAAAQLGAPLRLLDATLGRMANNIASASSGPNRVTVASTNLYALAAQQYGDPMAWTTLAKANGLRDPVIAGAATLAVPSSPALTGGVLDA